MADLCRKHGMSDATFYKWKAKFAGMDASQLRRLKDPETENSRLKRMYADARSRIRRCRMLLKKSCNASSAHRAGGPHGC